MSATKQKQQVEPALMSLNDACVYLDCSYSHLLKSIKSGELPALKLGSRWKVKKMELDKMIARRQRQNGLLWIPEEEI